jgi:NACHT domain
MAGDTPSESFHDGQRSAKGDRIVNTSGGNYNENVGRHNITADTVIIYENPNISVVNGVAIAVFQSLWGGGNKLFGIIGRSLDEKNKKRILSASNQYVQNYQERHGILKVLGMREPVTLESVYTAVQFLSEYDIRNFESIETLEAAYRQSNNRRFQAKDKPKQEGIKVANDKQYLMVLGGPGVGKSTFLRKMGLEALKGKKGKLKYNCIPVFIELKRFTSSDIDIEKIIAEEFSICGFPVPDNFTKEALESGNLLILFDGLDETPINNLNKVIEQIQNFVDKYHKNRFIASCRTARYRTSNFRRFSDVAIADFDDKQIQQFIYNWFQSDTDKQAGTAQKCWDLLQKQENIAAKELAYTPLLLTFLCLVYDRTQYFSNNRSKLYSKALRILLEEWAAEKRILQDEIYQGLHTELEEFLLSEIAYTGFEEDRLFFLRKEIVEQIKIYLENNLNAPRHLNGEAVLNAIAIQQGILVERAEDIFSFSHLTLQEYLTAYYIHETNQIQKLVTENLINKRWQEVFLLVAGLMVRGADDLLLLMEERTRKCINTSKLKDFLDWAQQVTNYSESNIKPVGKCAIAIAIYKAIANTRIDSTYAYSIADIYADDTDIYYDNVKANAKIYTDAYLSAKAEIYAYPNITVVAEKTYTDIFASAYATALRNAIPELTSDIASAIETANLSASYNDRYLYFTEQKDFEYQTKKDFEYQTKDFEYQTKKIGLIAKKIANNIIQAKLKGISNTQAVKDTITVINNSMNSQLSLDINTITRCVKKVDKQAENEADKIAENHKKDIINFKIESLFSTIKNVVLAAIELIHSLEKIKVFKTIIFAELIYNFQKFQAQFSDASQLESTRMIFVERIQQIWSIAFYLNSQLVNLSNDEVKALEDYLYANFFILKCKSASVRISSTTWQAIEEHMLLLPEDQKTEVCG